MKEVKNLLNIQKLIERFTKTKNRMKETYKEITDEEPCEKMFELFGKEFSFEYEEKPDMKFFPKGVYNLTENKWEK